MKIAILNPILFTATDGLIPTVTTIKDTMIYGMCLAFKKLGHEVTLIALDDYRASQPENYDFEIVFLKGMCQRVLTNALPFSPQLWKWLKINQSKFDMVISSETFSFHSLFAALLCPNKTIIWQELTAHQNKLHKIPSKIWHNIIARFLMKNVKCVVARSTKAKKFIAQYMPLVSDKIIDHGIDIDKFKFSASKEKQIISSSQLIHRKNVDGIIHKYAKFHKIPGYENFKLIIAGSGEQESQLKDLAKGLNLDGFVEFVGFLPQIELNRYIRTSMAFLVNTRKDLNMVSIPEAIVSGTPILTNLQPASADFVIKYKLGIAKQEWDENDIKEIVDNNTEYVKNCVEYRYKLSSEYAAQDFINIYNNEQR